MPAGAVGVGLLWIGTSAVFSTFSNGLFLRTFNDPFAHTFIRFAMSSAIGLAYAAIAARPLLKWLPRLASRLMIPSLLLLTANLLNSMSMQRSGVTVTYVVKSMIPFFTVMICRIRGQRFRTSVYASLLPVCAGVALASVTDMDFNVPGLCCALGSSLSQTLLNISSKERISALKLSGAQAFLVMATVCTAASAPLLLVSYEKEDGLVRMCTTGGCTGEMATGFTSMQVVLLAGVSYNVEYTLNFLFVALCSPLAFSVTDICRRLGTIVFGAFLFAKPLTVLNAAGVITSLMGVGSYTLVTRLGKPVVIKEPAGEEGLSASSGDQNDVEKGGTRDLKRRATWAANYGALSAPSGASAIATATGNGASPVFTGSDISRPSRDLSTPSLGSFAASSDGAEEKKGNVRRRGGRWRRSSAPCAHEAIDVNFLLVDDSSWGISPEVLCTRGVLSNDISKRKSPFRRAVTDAQQPKHPRRARSEEHPSGMARLTSA